MEKLNLNPDEIDLYNYSDCTNMTLQFININSKILSTNLNYTINLNNFFSKIKNIDIENDKQFE